jgi:acyl carrier protein
MRWLMLRRGASPSDEANVVCCLLTAVNRNNKNKALSKERSASKRTNQKGRISMLATKIQPKSMPPKMRQVRDWIASNAGVNPDSIAPDTQLVRDRVLTSLMILDLIGVIEDVRGRRLDPNSISATAFRDLDSIGTTFLGESASSPGVAQ